MSYKVIFSNIINPYSDTKCKYIPDGALILKKDQKKSQYIIDDICSRSSLKLKKILSQNDTIVENLKEYTIIPPFFDMHFHWVQDDVRGKPKADLLSWLNNFTFPAEDKFKNIDYSKKKAKAFFEKLTRIGTLGGGCYSSIHKNSLDVAFKYAKGDFVIGNVLMTQNSPKYLKQTSKKALSLVKYFSKKYRVNYAVTPRFAIAVDAKTMTQAVEISKGKNCFYQTHLSETPEEVQWSIDLFKDKKGFKNIKTYTDIYFKTGLLGPQTIMGHGIYLSDDELKLLSKKRTCIAHCPTSNASVREKGLGSGLFDFQRVEKHKVFWALGSDIGAGPYLSMFDVMRSFVEQNQKKNIKKATYIKALYRATLAGAKILKLDKQKGNFEKNKSANFLVLPKVKEKNLNTAELVLKYYIEKYRKNRSLYDHIVQKVYLDGECYFSKK